MAEPSRGSPCPETFGHDELPHEGFRMPCSARHAKDEPHRVHYEANHGGRVYDIKIEWTVKEVVHVTAK